MLVDLARMIWAGCRIQQRASDQLQKGIEVFTVMHITSEVESLIRDDRDACHRSTAACRNFAGSSQNPCMRDHRRTGKGAQGHIRRAIGYIDFTGNMDSCIAIRWLSKRETEFMCRPAADRG